MYLGIKYLLPNIKWIHSALHVMRFHCILYSAVLTLFRISTREIYHMIFLKFYFAITFLYTYTCTYVCTYVHICVYTFTVDRLLIRSINCRARGKIQYHLRKIRQVTFFPNEIHSQINVCFINVIREKVYLVRQAYSSSHC